MTTNITINQLIELAKQAENTDQIDWGELPVNEDLVYESIAYAMYNAYQKSSPATRELVLLASIIKVQVENFVLAQLNKQLLHTVTTLRSSKE